MDVRFSCQATPRAMPVPRWRLHALDRDRSYVDQRSSGAEEGSGGGRGDPRDLVSAEAPPDLHSQRGAPLPLRAFRLIWRMMSKLRRRSASHPVTVDKTAIAFIRPKSDLSLVTRTRQRRRARATASGARGRRRQARPGSSKWQQKGTAGIENRCGTRRPLPKSTNGCACRSCSLGQAHLAGYATGRASDSLGSVRARASFRRYSSPLPAVATEGKQGHLLPQKRLGNPSGQDSRCACL